DPYSERIDGPTPNGGVYAIAYWIGAGGKRATKDQAEGVEIVEFDSQDRAIHRTYASLKASRPFDAFDHPGSE
ncbi:MAG: hypothetical protein JO329_21515, partial [Planctomycetaceae bacterium]|nr:hypothetical protein [Planctomycetaceae bacterium]